MKDKSTNVIQSTSDILSGIPTFKDTRVPIKALIDYLAAGDTVEAFLDDFPTVSKEQVAELLKLINDKLPTLVA